jgi:hypothetical protein
MKSVHATVKEIFAACPELCAFSVQEAASVGASSASEQLEGDLRLADVETAPYAPSEHLLGEIAVALLELIDEQPEAVDELRGRTFARTLH